MRNNSINMYIPTLLLVPFVVASCNFDAVFKFIRHFHPDT